MATFSQQWKQHICLKHHTLLQKAVPNHFTRPYSSYNPFLMSGTLAKTMACPKTARSQPAFRLVCGDRRQHHHAQRAVPPPLHLVAVFTLRACCDITHILFHMQNAEQPSPLSQAMTTTEQPPAQKRSLASKGTCWIACVCGLLKWTLMSCSKIESPNLRSLRGTTKSCTRCTAFSPII